MHRSEKNQDDEIEEEVLDDDEINELFQVRDKPKSHVNQLNFYPTNLNLHKKVKRKKKDSKESKISKQCKEDSDDDDHSTLDDGKIDDTGELNESISNNSCGKQITASSASTATCADDDDELVCLDSEDSMIIDDINLDRKSAKKRPLRSSNKSNVKPTNSDLKVVDDEDEILICSNHNSPVKASSTTLDSSFDYTFDPNLLPADFKFVKTTRIKFKFKGSYHCVMFKSTDQFKDKLDEISQTLSIDTSSMILMFNDKSISFEETPESLGIGITDIIDVFEKKKEQVFDNKDDPNLFKLKFRDSESRKKNQDVLLTMNRYESFKKIFERYSQLKEVPLDQIIFEFDGERMSADDKPDDLDMESDSMIDVKIKGAH